MWQEKANTGYFVEVSKNTKGWGLYIRVSFDSAHLLCDEKIPHSSVSSEVAAMYRPRTIVSCGYTCDDLSRASPDFGSIPTIDSTCQLIIHGNLRTIPTLLNCHNIIIIIIIILSSPSFGPRIAAGWNRITSIKFILISSPTFGRSIAITLLY